MSVIILIKAENGENSEILLNTKIVIGRSSKADLVVNDNKISGRHCSLEVTNDGKVLFKDLDSTNGSYVFHTRVGTHYLRLHEEVTIGNTILRIDEKRLSPMERISIGKSTLGTSQKKEELTLPSVTLGSDKKTNSIVKPKEKSKKVVSVTGNEKLLEQEESTGHTKMLKIGTSVIKKQKKPT